MRDIYAMCVNSRNQVCVHGEVNHKGWYIRWFDGNNGSLIKEIKCRCQHQRLLMGHICQHPVDPDVIIETCHECSKIRSYNMKTDQSADIYTGAVRAICTGPAGSILGVDTEGLVVQFRWKDGSEEWELVHSVETNIKYVHYMCYVEHNNAVALSCWSPDRVCAVNLSDGSTLWEFNYQINENIHLLGLCHDTDRRIYMTVIEANGIIILDSRNGELLQHLIKDVKKCSDIYWTNTQPQLTVLHDFGMEISTFNVSRP